MAAFASSNTVIGSKYNMSSKYQVFLVSCFYFLLFFIRKVVAEQHFYNVTRLGAGRGGLGGKRQLGSCNLFQGKWVFDASYKFYDPRSCPFIDPEFNCLGHGRPDKQYLKYSWQPDSCKIPRFNGLDFLERWRGKKIMFVGDSLSLNMWQSLACMIHASVPSSKYSFVSRDSMHSVTFQYYGVSIMVYRTPYLVDIVREKGGNVLNLNSIEAGNVWKGMDMLIFNSWHWWTHTGKKSQGWDYIRDGSQLYQGMNHLVAFYKGMTTWARWVNMNVDPSKTKVFFQGISPTHYEGREWNQPRKNCYGEAEPLSGSTYPAGEPPAAAILNKVLRTVKKPVYLLDITTLSQLRKDAHPSTYGDGSSTDCSHWCLPGLPDTWNQLLYAALVM